MRYLIVLLVVVYVLVMTTMAHAQQTPWKFIGPGTIPASQQPALAGDAVGAPASNKLNNVQGYPVASTTPDGNGRMFCTSGGKWSACATATSAPTPMPTPTPGELTLTKSIVANLPTCNAGEDGAYRTVTDALLATCAAGTVVLTGGAVYCLVICQNGVGWINP